MKIEYHLIIFVFFILCEKYKKMFLGCLFCLVDKKKREQIRNREKKEEEKSEKIKYERMKYIPFVWKIKKNIDINIDMERNIQKLEKINQNGKNLQNSAKNYRKLSKELSEKVQKIE